MKKKYTKREREREREKAKKEGKKAEREARVKKQLISNEKQLNHLYFLSKVGA